MTSGSARMRATDEKIGARSTAWFAGPPSPDDMVSFDIGGLPISRDAPRLYKKERAIPTPQGLPTLDEDTWPSAIDHGVEQAIFLDEQKLGRFAIDRHRSPGVVEADRLRARDRADPPELRGRRPAAGGDRDPLAGAE